MWLEESDGNFDGMYISEERIQSVLTYEALIPAIRQALVDYSFGGKVEQPLRQILRVKDLAGNAIGGFATMPVVAGEFLAVKTVTFYPGNAGSGSSATAGRKLPTHQATIELLDRATGEPLAVLDGRLITEMRTAAVSAVAAQALAPAAKTLGILGSGVQARAHIAALRHVLPALRERSGQSSAVRLWSRNAAKAAALAAEIGGGSVPVEEAAAADIVVTATSATTPVLFGKWLSPDALVLAVGAVGPSFRELDDDVMQGCLIAESRQGSLNESGDVLLSGAKVFAEIGEVLAGNAPPIPAGRLVFKSLGMAIEDLTGAALVWKALQTAVG